MDRGMISRGFVEDALQSLHQRGIDPASALAKAGIPVTAEGDGSVTNNQYGVLWLEIVDLIQDEFFGLARRPMRPGSFEMLCRCVMGSETLEVALRRSLRFLAIVLDDPRGRLSQKDGLAEVHLDDKDGTRSAFAHRTFWLIVLGIACWLIGRRIALRRVDFSSAAPQSRSDYGQFFGAPVQFDMRVSRLAFDASYLQLPVIREAGSLRLFLKNAPANILVRYRHDQGVSARLRSLLRQSTPHEWPGFDEIATRFKLSPATLRRKLQGEGQSFNSIKDELRYAAARDILASGNEAIASIASRLGYAEPSAFHRAFLKWSGSTPAAYRKTFFSP
ncbi:AraC family transcriptional regulator [Agrobacterium arsenijevicii]|uniref:AraC family transcriptional regulator n=1 Tax=Agrobacterium arsenijevicii TaxID=1585697 RepID=A0ABR5CZQ9_9HYPH|nr:AraC family transcriptional regulator [Agrobacterium arsenijevicii]